MAEARRRPRRGRRRAGEACVVITTDPKRLCSDRMRPVELASTPGCATAEQASPFIEQMLNESREHTTRHGVPSRRATQLDVIDGGVYSLEVVGGEMTWRVERQISTARKLDGGPHSQLIALTGCEIVTPLAPRSASATSRSGHSR